MTRLVEGGRVEAAPEGMVVSAIAIALTFALLVVSLATATGWVFGIVATN